MNNNMTEENKQAKRIQTSFLNGIEKKILVAIANKLPTWVTSDMLTFVGFLGAIIIATGFALSNLNLNWLWLTCFGLFVNWYGDSLDGSLARVRGTQRKTYGFYIDHNVDVINETIMFVGAGTSPLVNMSFAMLALIAYFMLSVYVYINCHLKGEHKLTYAGLGPTEFRIIVAIVCILFMYIPWLSEWKKDIVLFHNQFSVGLFDYITVAIALLIFGFYLVSFFKDAAYFRKIDPIKKPEDKK